MPSNLSIQVPVTASKVALAATAALAGAFFADKRYGISLDLNQLHQEKEFGKRLQDRIRMLGQDLSLHHMLELADPGAEALWFEGRRWSYSELILESNKLATILRQKRVIAGDAVAIFAVNSPEMVIAIAATSKLGAVPALINSALRAQTLQHCFHIARPKLALCTPDLASNIAELEGFDHSFPTLSLSLSSFAPLELSAEAYAAANIVQLRHEDLYAAAYDTGPRAPRLLKDVGTLIFTSGTSGKPKAVAVKNFLLVVVSTPFTVDAKNAARYLPLRTFSCLPLFHATCLFTGLYYSTGLSGTFCLARKFSASRFTAQLVESGATRMLYVGELCRYLWRFRIPEIREVYRSTEGVAKFDNFTHRKAGAGMVGFAGPVKLYSEKDVFLVKYDPSTQSLYRDPKTGFCVLTKAGEPGEAIGRVRSMDFYNEYYNDPAATQLKLVSNVFEKGDLFQRTGDLLMRQKWGWIRFHDRSGDTFRWRGENVSVSEVQDHISKLPGVQDCSVYAVKLPAYDGQAGAAAITLTDPQTETEFIQQLYPSLRSSGLALYQLPKLVRFRPVIETTATFKQSKAILKSLPWSPDTENQQDSLFWLNGEQYRRIDTDSWTQIESGKARL